MVTQKPCSEVLAQLAQSILRAHAGAAAHPAALPVHLPHLFWPLLSLIRSKFSENTALWREIDRFICTGNVGIKLQEWSSLSLLYLCHSLSLIRSVPVVRTAKHSDKAKMLPELLCSVMLPKHLCWPCRALPGSASSAHLRTSDCHCQKQRLPRSFQCSWVKYLSWIQRMNLSIQIAVCCEKLNPPQMSALTVFTSLRYFLV